jgi:hypothetical protein
LALARAGWNVVGVDFSLIAVTKARWKLLGFGDQVSIRYGDVTNLRIVSGSYQLILDIGCFHSLTSLEKIRYLENFGVILATYGYVLMYAHFGTPGEAYRRGILESDVDRMIQKIALIERTDSADPGGRPASWLLFQRKVDYPVGTESEAESRGQTS